MGKTGQGIDVVEGGTADCGVLDLLHTKKEAIKLATDAAVTVLRVDRSSCPSQRAGRKRPNRVVAATMIRSLTVALLGLVLPTADARGVARQQLPRDESRLEF